jgi:hypothetical protein
VVVAVWYAGPGATDYRSALANGYNAGWSQAVPIRLASGVQDPYIADLRAMNSFGTGLIPEPSTTALGALGGAALLLFRRRK